MSIVAGAHWGGVIAQQKIMRDASPKLLVSTGEIMMSYGFAGEQHKAK